MINFFNPNQFRSPNSDGSFCIEEFIYQAHKLLEERCVRVYGHVGKRLTKDYDSSWTLTRNIADTHESLMLPPWEIKKKECVEHYPLQRLINGSWECRACGKKLKPKWEAINE